MPDSMLQDTVDFSLKSDSTAPDFQGTSKDWRDYWTRLESHLNWRGLADLARLGIGELLMVQTDGSKQEAKRVRVLGDHCKRALYMRLNVSVKKEPENSGSSAKQPKSQDEGRRGDVVDRDEAPRVSTGC